MGKNELINEPSSMIPVLPEDKALERDKYVITAWEEGSRTFTIAHEGNIIGVSIDCVFKWNK